MFCKKIVKKKKYKEITAKGVHLIGYFKRTSNQELLSFLVKVIFKFTLVASGRLC